jgi:hypothetical protein
MSEIDLSQLTPEALTQLQRDIRKDRERRRREGQEMRLTTFADLANIDQAQIEQLEREAYPRKHWDTVEEALRGSNTHLIAGIGEWKYDPELLTVTNENSPGYPVYLERLTTPAKLLDTILQLTTKGYWAYDSLGELIGLLKIICQEKFGKNMQGVFCPFGESRTVQWPTAHEDTGGKND